MSNLTIDDNLINVLCQIIQIYDAFKAGSLTEGDFVTATHAFEELKTFLKNNNINY
jgi:hypothetical protein